MHKLSLGRSNENEEMLIIRRRQEWQSRQHPDIQETTRRIRALGNDIPQCQDNPEDHTTSNTHILIGVFVVHSKTQLSPHRIYKIT
jgi:hypothetical protein